MSEEIPRHISLDEVIVRGVFSNKVKKGKILFDIFMPYPKGLSGFRLRYTSIESCSAKSQEIATEDRKYVGLLKIATEIIRIEANELFPPDLELIDASGNPIVFKPGERVVDVFGTPMIDDKNYYPDDKQVFTDSQGNPAHSDIRYKAEIETFKPAPQFIRSIARHLLSKSEFV